jgi:hypothetical protein
MQSELVSDDRTTGRQETELTPRGEFTNTITILRTAGISVSRPLPRIAATVSLLVTEPALSPGGGTGLLPPKATFRRDRPKGEVGWEPAVTMTPGLARTPRPT